MSEVRVRFAPSPTGYLHVGGARTALFNWLFARHHKGKFLLRIEDTDRQRSTPEAVKAIFDGLSWLGLDWDEEPVFQSSRLREHQRLVEELLQRGSAYRCFCDPQKLTQERNGAVKSSQEFGYPGTCRHLSAEEIESKLSAGVPFAVRFKTVHGRTSFTDVVNAEVNVDNREIGDFILQRRDGTPVYQVAVVADDSFMGITHVIRGDDHLTNTPKQILIYKALGLPIPQFAHVPLILGTDRKRLSKRHGATSVMEYQRRGILSEAMRNFLLLLGWSPGDERELMTTEEMIASFHLEGINASGAVFDEIKLQWMNGQYMARLSVDQIWSNIQPHLRSFCQQANLPEPEEELGRKLAALYRERLRSFSEAPQRMGFFFQDPVSYDEKGMKKHWKSDTSGQLKDLLSALKELPVWKVEALETCVNQTAEKHGTSRAHIIHPLRLALTGGTASPGIFEIMEILGREICLRRMQTVLEVNP